MSVMQCLSEVESGRDLKGHQSLRGKDHVEGEAQGGGLSELRGPNQAFLLCLRGLFVHTTLSVQDPLCGFLQVPCLPWVLISPP